MSEVIFTASGLIACKACDKQIAKTAKDCPSCGAANDWIHPRIEAFRANEELSTPRPFKYWTTPTKVWGHAPEKSNAVAIFFVSSAVWLIPSVILADMFGLLFGILAFNAIIILPIAIVIHKNTKKHQVDFETDLAKGSWSSNDEAFWLPVKSALGL